MADVEIVIKLSDKNCEHLKRLGALWVKSENGSSIVSKALLEGTILPKWHGRLIDADELKKEYQHDTDYEYPVNTNSYVVESIDNMPTIIEADTAERGKE